MPNLLEQMEEMELDSYSETAVQSNLIPGIEVFLIDPPWPKKLSGKRILRPNLATSLPYSTFGVPEIFSLLDARVLSLGANPYTVFMWTIEEFLIETEQMMSQRGYHRHCRIIWDKITGFFPAFTVKYTHEYLIWYYKPKMNEISIDVRGKYTTVMREQSRQHSRKPECCYKMLEDLFPVALKADIFCRQVRPGWLQYGNEIERF